MDFLKQLALPQAVEHFHLLLLVGGLIAVVFLPYLAFLLGASFLSFRYNRTGRTEGNRLHLQFAKDLIDTVLFNKTVPTFLALLPGLSLVFVTAQLLQSTEAISVGLVGYAFILLLVAVVLLYTYKYTFRLSDFLDGYEVLLKGDQKGERKLGEVEDYKKQTIASHLKAGRYGIILLALAAFLVVSSMAVTTNPMNWTAVSTIFELFISLDVLVRVLQFVAFALGVTGIGILFFFFAWQGGKKGMDEEYSRFVRRIGLRLAVTSLLTQPILILLGIALLPGVALSGSLYLFTGSSLAMMFLAAHFVYVYSRDPLPRYVEPAFYGLVFASVLLSVNDQLAIHNATKTHAAFLAYRHEQTLETIKASLGIAALSMTGEDIFNARCSACHLFDQKKVGPAYRDVIPKYAGKKAQLVAFVLNPAKVDPAFPPMPNQGLRPAEADSIASYLLGKLAEAGSKLPIPSQGKTQRQ
ncbi:MAG: c-type cytochrome [Bacteroidota bacterium]